MRNINKRLFIVIHALTTDHHYEDSLNHVIHSAKTAFNAHADGVFLIPDYEKGNLKANLHDLLFYYGELRYQFRVTNFKIGINFLLSDLSRLVKAIKHFKVEMIQTDSYSLSKKEFSEIEIFTGIAFKYSKNVNATGEDLRLSCERAVVNGDVPTTSGVATGIGPEVNKIKEIRSYLPSSCRLGVASGVNIQNVKGLMDAGATDFLVATSLIKEVRDHYDILDKYKILELAKIIKPQALYDSH